MVDGASVTGMVAVVIGVAEVGRVVELASVPVLDNKVVAGGRLSLAITVVPSPRSTMSTAQPTTPTRTARAPTSIVVNQRRSIMSRITSKRLMVAKAAIGWPRLATPVLCPSGAKNWSAPGPDTSPSTPVDWSRNELPGVLLGRGSTTVDRANDEGAVAAGPPNIGSLGKSIRGVDVCG